MPSWRAAAVLVTIAVLQSIQDCLALDVGQRSTGQRCARGHAGSFGRSFDVQIVPRNHRSIAEGRGTLEHILQLADVSRPVVSEQPGAGIVGQRAGRRPPLPGNAGQEGIDERANILAPGT